MREDYKIKMIDPNARCKYHFSATGHSIEICSKLKYKIQDLINLGLLDVDSLLREYSQEDNDRSATINMITINFEDHCIHDVDTLLMSLPKMLVHLQRAGRLIGF
ncbi:hypothetical protein CDL15_Pgr026449 [Punica granatum]|uniref:Uncharacterized protein n=1 Tax=Punica granatum TaxID=22663 RepID=A0A218XJ13_PUNGR|nr:hypothetical protein CDL15_Pgr026449 [Punica granatum]